MNHNVAKQVARELTGAGRPDLALAFARTQVSTMKKIKAAGGEAVPLPKKYAKEAEKLKVKGYKYMAQMLNEDGTPFGEPLPFKTSDQMARFMRTEKMKIDWYSTFARTKVTAKSNSEVVRELKQMGILPQTENAGSYPAIGQDPTWMSLYSHKTVKAKTAAVAKCLRAGKTKLANVVAKIPVRAAPLTMVSYNLVDTLGPAVAEWMKAALGNIHGKKGGALPVTVTTVETNFDPGHGDGGIDFTMTSSNGVTIEGGVGYVLDTHVAHILVEVRQSAIQDIPARKAEERGTIKKKASKLNGDLFAKAVADTIRKAAKAGKITL